MALITFSGYPASGKSTRALQLKSELDNLVKDCTVTIVSEESLNIHRCVYDDSRLEKPARGTLFAAIQRQISPNTVLIVDAPNYIKGFRYQIYCAAREMKLRVCTVYVVATQHLCRQWNAARAPEERYKPETLENLFLRYEEPSSMVRWDSPLFTISWTDVTIPTSDILSVITTGSVKPPNSGTLNAAKAPTDALLVLESVTSAIVSAFMSAQSMAGAPGSQTKLSISGTLNSDIVLPPRAVTLSELQRFKRQFVTIHKKAITLGTTERGAVDWSEDKVAQKFVVYLEENFNS